jgi:hypothetical protein
MPIHDWTRVEDGIFHHFHHEWISTISRTLNAGLLPAGYYALAEQIAAGREPDVLALEHSSGGPFDNGGNGAGGDEVESGGGTAVRTAPPKVRFTSRAESEQYARKQSRVAIRHVSGDRVVALVEIVSPGNKSSQHALHAFVEKARDFLQAGVHLLVLDLFPPGSRDPQGIHGAIWSAIENDSFRLPPGEPLTLVAYEASPVKAAYIEPTAVGRELAEMPLFLAPGGHVPVPLEPTYEAAFAAVPARWRKVLEAPATESPR